MKTLNDFKNEVAKENGFFNWDYLLSNSEVLFIDTKADLAAERYAEYMAIEFYKYKIYLTNDNLDEYYKTEFKEFKSK